MRGVGSVGVGVDRSSLVLVLRLRSASKYITMRFWSCGEKSGTRCQSWHGRTRGTSSEVCMVRSRSKKGKEDIRYSSKPSRFGCAYAEGFSSRRLSPAHADVCILFSGCQFSLSNRDDVHIISRLHTLRPKNICKSPESGLCLIRDNPWCRFKSCPRAHDAYLMFVFSFFRLRLDARDRRLSAEAAAIGCSRRQ